MKRMLCLWWPHWPLQRLIVAQPELQGQPLILIVRDPRRGELVVECSRAARQLGIRPGMPVTEAHVLAAHPPYRLERSPWQRGSPLSAPSTTKALHCRPYLPDEDRQHLLELADRLQQFSPLVALEDRIPPSALLLDVTGSAPRLGGEPALLRELLTLCQTWGYRVRASIAPSVGAAWAVTHYGSLAEPPILHDEDLQMALAELPVDALRLPATCLESLYALGITRVRQLWELPRTSLMSRFGPELLQRWDQALGRLPEALGVLRYTAMAEVHQLLEHPTGHRAGLQTLLRQLSDQLATQLISRGLGALQIEGELLCTDGRSLRWQVGFFQPAVLASQFQELLWTRLERQRLPGPVQRMTLRVLHAAPWRPVRPRLFADATEPDPNQLARLVECLSSRLGPQAVSQPQSVSDPLPEKAVFLAPLTGKRKRTTIGQHFQDPPRARQGVRPLSLLADLAQGTPSKVSSRPEPIRVVCGTPQEVPILFQDRTGSHAISHAWGPERIETGWWRGPCVRRDYYRVEDRQGYRYWLFRDLQIDQWFLHGTFD